MQPVYGQPPVIGYSSSIEELRVDFEIYDMVYKATQAGNGSMTPEQLVRYDQLTQILTK